MRFRHAPFSYAHVAPGAATWAMATFAGWGLGLVLAIAFLILVESPGIRPLQFPLAVGMGLGVGITQARLIGDQVGGRAPWTIASTLGLAAPFIVSDIVAPGVMQMTYSLPTHIALGGLVVGVLQWRVLRPVSTRAAWWIAASGVGWTLAAATALTAQLLPRVPGVIGALMYLTVVLFGGLVLGTVGAPTLIRISRSATHVSRHHDPSTK